jgi:hypothetical protein
MLLVKVKLDHHVYEFMRVNVGCESGLCALRRVPNQESNLGRARAKNNRDDVTCHRGQHDNPGCEPISGIFALAPAPRCVGSGR